MAGSIGNKNAAGSSYDIDAEARALDAWSKTDGATALVHFCVERDIHAQRIYEWRDANESFAEVLKKTKARIASRIRQQLHNKESPYNYGLFQREIGSHDAFLHDFEESTKDKEADRRARALKSEAQASELEKQKVLKTISKGKKVIK